MLDFFWNLASFIVVLGILITVHEYGHFWVARKNGVQVERFSVGFGKVLWSSHDKQGTEFVIAMIPLGGYVKMLDSRVDPVSDTQLNKAFDHKTVSQRIAIIAAGPLTNFIFAILAYYLVFLIGIASVKPIVGEIQADSVAAKGGLESHSEIIAISGQRTLDWQDVNLALVSAIGDEKITLTYKNINSASNREIELNTHNWQFSPDKELAITSLGISPYRPNVYAKLALVAKDSPAEKAGFQVGDELLTIAGESINGQWQEFSKKIKHYPDKTVTVTVMRNGVLTELMVKPEARKYKDKMIGYLGVQPVMDAYPKEYLFDHSYGPIEALQESVGKTWNMISLSFNMLGKLFTGHISINNLSGPLSIAQGAGHSASGGFSIFLGFLAFISISLGVMNLLPLPVLDGGHLFYYFIELCTGKPVPEKIQEIGFKFGTIALLSLMSIAIFNDFSRL